MQKYNDQLFDEFNKNNNIINELKIENDELKKEKEKLQKKEENPYI